MSDITAAHAIRPLAPNWATKTETASRVRSRIELVLDVAAARELREGLNPARWRGNLDAALPKASKVAKDEHHPAVPVAEIPVFMKRLAQQAGMRARALEFLILTPARSGEVRGATWAEIHIQAALWVVPAERMKAGREHRVPLSPEAVVLLRAVGQGKPAETIFAGNRGPLSDMSPTAVLRRMKVQATVHGFRSSFRDGVAECTAYPSEAAEMALEHAVGAEMSLGQLAAAGSGPVNRPLPQAWQRP